jgi:hypothetical protein
MMWRVMHEQEKIDMNNFQLLNEQDFKYLGAELGTCIIILRQLFMLSHGKRCMEGHTTTVQLEAEQDEKSWLHSLGLCDSRIYACGQVP